MSIVKLNTPARIHSYTGIPAEVTSSMVRPRDYLSLKFPPVLTTEGDEVVSEFKLNQKTTLTIPTLVHPADYSRMLVSVNPKLLQVANCQWQTILSRDIEPQPIEVQVQFKKEFDVSTLEYLVELVVVE